MLFLCIALSEEHIRKVMNFQCEIIFVSETMTFALHTLFIYITHNRSSRRLIEPEASTDMQPSCR